MLVAWGEGLRSYEDMEDRLTFVAMARYSTSRWLLLLEDTK
jgi:hypothetical protein